MLSHLDFIIFPDRCEVLEIVPSQRYFYPIFKNGSSSIHEQAKESKWRTYLNEQIKRISSVDVVIREPQQRFLSGINSFVAQTTADNPTLDRATIIWFVKNYLHLNRHYSTQYSWLVNLARYSNPDIKINLIGIEDIVQITKFKEHPWKHKDEALLKEFTNISTQEMYNRLDTVLYNAIGKSLTFQEINELIQAQDPDAYQQVIQRSQRILNPTYVVPKT